MHRNSEVGEFVNSVETPDDIHSTNDDKNKEKKTTSSSNSTTLTSSDIIDIKVTVKEYRKVVDTYETYVVFLIQTESSRLNLPQNNFSVERRFNDFIWLRSRLENTFPLSIIPPLPDKHNLTQIERFAGSFIDQRLVALDKFMKRLAAHPVQSFNEHFIEFITSDRDAFLRHQQQHGGSGNGILSRLKSQIVLPNSLVGYPVENVTINDPFYTLYKQAEHLHSVMNRIEKACEQITSESTTWQKELVELSEQYSLLSQSELHDATTTETTTTTSGSSGSSFTLVSNMDNAWRTIGNGVEPLLDVNKSSILPTVHEYGLFADVILQVLRKRGDTENQLYLTRQKMERNRQQSKALQEGGENYLRNSRSSSLTGFLKKKQTPQEVEEALKVEFEKLKHSEAELQDRLARESEEFLSAYSRWRTHEFADLGGILKLLADQQIKHYEASVDAWTKTLKSINANVSA